VSKSALLDVAERKARVFKEQYAGASQQNMLIHFSSLLGKPCSQAQAGNGSRVKNLKMLKARWSSRQEN
jgi:hypothetical protein